MRKEGEGGRMKERRSAPFGAVIKSLGRPLALAYVA